MSRTVRITVAEPSEIVRRGVSGILKKARLFNAEVAEIADPAQLRSSLAWQRPDVLIINPSIVGAFSMSGLKKDAANPDMKCVALQTSLADAALLREYDETIQLYDSAEQIAAKLARLVSGPEAEKQSEALSQREKEVVVCVVKGMTNKQIADKLFLSAHTVITHRRNISAKLDIHSTAGLTIYAIVNKLVGLDEVGNRSDK